MDAFIPTSTQSQIMHSQCKQVTSIEVYVEVNNVMSTEIAGMSELVT